MIPSEFFCRSCDRTVRGDEPLLGIVVHSRLESEPPAVLFHSCRTVLFARGVSTEEIVLAAQRVFR